MVLSVDGVPSGTVDPAGVVVEVDGRQVDSQAKTVAAGDISRSTVLVLDASNSMAANGKFDAAKAAVTAYLDAAPEDVAIGMVTFAGDVVESIEPTTDHASVAAALDAVKLSKGTGVYDAIRAGVDLAGDDGSRSLLVLSDGADTSSDSTLDVAMNDAREAGVVVDVVSIGTAAKAESLAALADGHGRRRVIPADPDALSSVFTAQADALAEQLLAHLRLPRRRRQARPTITVSAEAGGTTYVDSAFVTLDSGRQRARLEVVEPRQGAGQQAGHAARRARRVPRPRRTALDRALVGRPVRRPSVVSTPTSTAGPRRRAAAGSAACLGVRPTSRTPPSR